MFVDENISAIATCVTCLFAQIRNVFPEKNIHIFICNYAFCHTQDKKIQRRRTEGERKCHIE
jgi:hypothetical protein